MEMISVDSLLAFIQLEKEFVDVVKTGYIWEQVWGTDGWDFRCSHCRKFKFHNGEMRKKYKYCPNCGAKMGGGKDDE